MFAGRRRLNIEITELETAERELHELFQNPQGRTLHSTSQKARWRHLPRWLIHLKIKLEELNPDEVESNPDLLKQCILENTPSIVACLYGDDQKAISSGAYFGNDGKLYSLESIYQHLCRSPSRDRSPLVPTLQNPWAVTQSAGITRLLRFCKRHSVTLPTPDSEFWQNLGVEPYQGDASTLLAYALNSQLQTKLTALQKRAIESNRTLAQDDLSPRLIEWTTIFLRTLAFLRDDQGNLCTNQDELLFLKNGLTLQPDNPRTLPEKMDEWCVLEYYLDLLCNTILIDPFTQFPLKESAVVLNDEKALTVNQSTADKLRPRHPELDTEPHPALPAFFDWIKTYLDPIKAIRVHRRHLAALERDRATDAYQHAQNRVLIDALQAPLRMAIGAARQKMQQKLNDIEQEITATDERIAQLAEHTQRTDARIQTLKADMEECSHLWEVLLQELLPRQDAEIERGIVNAQAMQLRIQAIKDQAERIHQQLDREIQTHKREHERLSNALSKLNDDTHDIADQHLAIEKDIVKLRQEIAERQSGFFGQIAIAAGFVIGAIAGCGVGAAALHAGILSTQAAYLTGLGTCAATTTFFAITGGEKTGDLGYRHRSRLGSQA